MKNRIKTLVVVTLRAILKLGWILPVSGKKVLFNAYEGMQYGCNPKYIFENLEKKNPDLDFVWVMNNPNDLPDEYRAKVKIVKFLSLAHIKALLTSKVIVSNLGIEPFFPKRKSQTFINTWHGGGAYKRVASDMDIFSISKRRYVRKMRDLRSKSTDIFLSSCSRFTDVSSKDFAVDINKFIASGLPRNDRLVDSKCAPDGNLRESICRENGIDSSSLLVLYAPTFRGDFRKQTNVDNDICCRQVEEAFCKRFGRPVTFLFRSHVSKENSHDVAVGKGVKIVSMTDYPDMQELLEISDILITDYSSSIWDFALTGKPGFLYMPDVAEYLKQRGFYTPLEDWPYPYAESVVNFVKIIGEYDEIKSKIKIRRHLDLLGSHERGIGRDVVTRIILDKMDTP